jgi:hypothetical protein
MTTQDHRAGLLTPGELALAWSAFFITAYGVLVIAASIFADKELVPSELPLTGALLGALLAAGAAFGAALGKATNR